MSERLTELYVVWPEGSLDKARCAHTRIGAEFLAFWMGLKTWIDRDPQRICIGFTGT